MTSTIKVNTITTESGSTITIGGCGKTVALASGAFQSGFGRSGSVDWQTTPKTSTFTAVNGEGYFVNASGAMTMNLPAGSAGAIVAVSDYARNFQTNALTISPNGSEKIGGVADDLILSVNGQALTLIYVDSTKGWINVQNAEDTETGIAFMSATGGSTANDGNFRVHTFTGPGTFCVSSVGTPGAGNTVDYLVVGGGGGGGYCMGGGGGAGGYRESPGSTTCYTASPLGASPATALTVTQQGYPIVVGGGGAGATAGPATGTNGNISSFQTIPSAGGGGGGTRPGAVTGANGGSGGGGANDCGAGGTGNTPPVTPPQGKNGGTYQPGFNNSSGGGGAKCAGTPGAGPPSAPQMGPGGDGTPSAISGSAVVRAGGGGGGGYPPQGHKAGTGGAGGGGHGGGTNPTIPICNVAAADGTANTGGGGGGGKHASTPNPGHGGTGGSGVVIIRYKFQ